MIALFDGRPLPQLGDFAMLFHTLLQRMKNRPTRLRTARKPATRRCTVEVLEDRSLLSGSPLGTGTAAAAYGNLPLAFEANLGQDAPGVDFQAHGSGYTLSLTPQAAVLDLSKGPGSSGDVLSLGLVGADPAASVVGLDPLITKSNYLMGSDPRGWITNVPNFGKVQYDGVYRGIDLVYYGNQGQLEYDFTVAPGADPSAIRLAIQGAESISLDGQGELVLHTGGGDVTEQSPVVYQMVNGSRQMISGRFVLQGNYHVGFQVGAYDPSRPLVIDPTLSYSTYLNGSGNPGAGISIAVDSSGNAYITGTTSGGNHEFTTLGHGVFVDKLNAGGTALVYQTVLGNNDTGGASGIAVDTAGDAYVTGLPGSSFPTTPGAFQPTRPSGATGFVSVLGPSGSTLLYSSFLPGATFMQLGDYGFFNTPGPTVAIDNTGNGSGLLDNLYVAGEAASGLSVTAGAFQTTCVGASGLPNAFFAKFNPNLSGSASLLYSSYLGGSGGDNATGIAVDSSGNAYLGGVALANLPTTPGAFQTTLGSSLEDAFVAKFNPALGGAASLVYCTYLGGTSGYTGNIRDAEGIGGQLQVKGVGIAVDSSGDAYLTGGTTSTTFPTTPGAFQTTRPWTWSGFVTKFNATGSGLIYSTYLGGTVNGPYPYQGGSGIAVDSSGDAYVSGWTGMTNFPTKNPIQATLAGDENVFVTTLNSSGSGLLFSTYLGGSSSYAFDFGFGLALDSANNIYVTGLTTSSNFPTTAGALQTASSSAFAFKITAPVAPAGSLSVAGFPTSTTAGGTGTVTVTALNASGGTNTGYTGTVHFSSSDPHAVLPADYTFTAADQGVHTFTVTLETAGTQAITATDSANGLLGSDTGIAVSPAAASTLTLAGYPSPTNAGLAGSFTVTALDPYSNVATGYTGTVHFTSSDSAAALPADYTFTAADNGVHTFSATLNTTGTQSLTATDTVTGTITGTLGSITVDAAGLPAVSFSVTGFPSPTTAGVSETISVTALDMNGAVAGSYRGTVHFTSSDPQAGLPANYTFTNFDQGVHTFTVTLKTAGTQWITATDTVTSSITGSETGITITPAAAAVFVLSAPSSVTHGTGFSVTLTIYDAFGNVATGYTGTVHFSSSDSRATLPANYTFKASDHGVHTFSGLVFKRTGTQTLTVADTVNGALTVTDSISVV
jgi:hypothetical protein